VLREALNAPSTAAPTSQSFGILVLEIAADLEPLADILNRHGITKTQWLRLRHTPVFVAALKEQVKAFQSLSNISARVKLKAQLITERLLDHMYDIASHPSVPPSARVSAFASVKSLTGMEKPDEATPFRRFSLTINLANGQHRTENAVTLNAIAERDAADEDPSSNSLLDDQTAIVDIEEDPFEDQSENVFPAVSEPDDLFTTPTSAPASVGDRTWNSFRTSPGPPLKHPAPRGGEVRGDETKEVTLAKPKRASALEVINRLRGT
jgi:hypothetical protein